MDTNGQADLSKRVVALAGSADWSIQAATEQFGAVDVGTVIAGYERGLLPLAETEPLDGKGPLAMAIEDSLAVIAVKLNPTMSADQSDAWTKAVRAALSDLPGRVLREATARAVHRPIRFFPEVDGVVREIAVEIMDRHRAALWRLKQWRKMMEAAANPPPALPAPENVDMLTDEELQSMPDVLRKMGIGAGWLEEDADGRLSWKKEDDDGQSAE